MFSKIIGIKIAIKDGSELSNSEIHIFINQLFLCKNPNVNLTDDKIYTVVIVDDIFAMFSVFFPLLVLYDFQKGFLTLFVDLILLDCFCYGLKKNKYNSLCEDISFEKFLVKQLKLQ